MPISSQNMSLLKWTSLSDRFDYLELAENWDKVDAHDHTSGKGVQIPSAGLAPFAVSEDKLANNAVSENKIQNNAVTGGKIKSSATVDADRAISTDHIKDNSITSAKMSESFADEIENVIELGISQLQELAGIPEDWVESAGIQEEFAYYYDTSTADSDPGTGEFRLNDSELESVIKINLSATDQDAKNATSILSQVTGAGKKAIIRIESESGAYGVYRLDSYTGSTPTSPAYFIINVTHVESVGNFSAVSSTERLSVKIYSIGLMNGWSGLGKYYKDALGRVYIQVGKPGEPASGPWNAVAFYLPEGYRPAESVWVPSYPGMLRIYPDGRVRPMNNLLGFEPKDETAGPQTPLFIATGSFRAAA